MSYSSARQLEHVINFEINESSKPNKSTSRARWILRVNKVAEYKCTPNIPLLLTLLYTRYVNFHETLELFDIGYKLPNLR